MKSSSNKRKFIVPWFLTFLGMHYYCLVAIYAFGFETPMIEQSGLVLQPSEPLVGLFAFLQIMMFLLQCNEFVNRPLRGYRGGYD